MPYSTITDIINRLPEIEIKRLTDDNDSGSYDNTVITECIEQADGVIDGNLAGIYTIPLSSTPTLIKKLSCDISIYLFFQRRVNEIPTAWLKNYNDAMMMLKEIRKGNVILNGIDTILETQSGNSSTGTVITQYWDEDSGESSFFDY